MFTVLSIGLGHLYCGEVRKAIILFAGWQGCTVLAFATLLLVPPMGLIFALTISITYSVYCIVDAIKCAKPLSAAYTLKGVNKWYIYILFGLIASFLIRPVIGEMVKHHIAQAFKIPSGAMQQTLEIGDRIITNKFSYQFSSPQKGDVVVFPFPNDPEKKFIKRIIGLGGEFLEIKNKHVYIDGQIVDETFVNHGDVRIFDKEINPRDNYGPVTIPADSVFVMGDNRDYSSDSRFWGFVKASSIEGKAVSIYWSWDKENASIRWRRIGKAVE